MAGPDVLERDRLHEGRRARQAVKERRHHVAVDRQERAVSAVVVTGGNPLGRQPGDLGEEICVFPNVRERGRRWKLRRVDAVIPDRLGRLNGVVHVHVVVFRSHSDGVLHHHVVVFVWEVVAVDHVPAAVRTKFYQQLDGLPLTDIDHVLGPPFVGEICAVLSTDDLEVNQVNVQGMEPAARAVVELPDLGSVQLRVRDHFAVVAGDDVSPRPVVD